MTNKPQDFVAQTYDPRANDYVKSEVHAFGPDLDQIRQLLTSQKDASVLDLGCGGGHVSYTVAPLVKQVTACDISQKMLDVVKETANNKSLPNIVTQKSPAENLPFQDQQFDWVITRFSSHHWHNLALGIQEIKRVLKASGTAIIMDTIAPLDKATDSFLQTIELLRDHSHVRNYGVAEYATLFSLNDLTLSSITQRNLKLEFSSWIGRTKPSSHCVEAIKELQSSAPEHIKANLQIQSDHSFSLPTATFILNR